MFCWLLVASEPDGELDPGRLTWNINYSWHNATALMATSNVDEEAEEAVASAENREEQENRRFTTQLSLQKDDIQSVIPVARVSFQLFFFNT